MADTPCPCGLPRPYAGCCGRWHASLQAPDPEALMRSRYSAFVLGLADYLLATWHPDTRPSTLELEADQRWLGLQVRHAHTEADGLHGTVEFVARCRGPSGRAERLHETSRFVRDNGRWFYVDGDQPKRSA